MPEPLAAHLRLDDLHAAFLAHDAAVLHALVFAAVALPIFRWAKDLRTEKPIALRLESPIIDGLRFLHLAVRPLTDFLRRCNTDTDAIEIDGLPGFFEEFQNAVQPSSSSTNVPKRCERRPAFRRREISSRVRRSS